MDTTLIMVRLNLITTKPNYNPKAKYHCIGIRDSTYKSGKGHKYSVDTSPQEVSVCACTEIFWGLLMV